LTISNDATSPINGKTEIIYGSDNVEWKSIQFIQNAIKKMDICFDNKGASIVTKIDAYTKGYNDMRKRGGKIRCVTEITAYNIDYCKKLFNMVDELRHFDGLKGSLAVNETEYMATNTLEEAKPLTELIYSNIKEIVKHHQYTFNTFWNKAIPFEQRIRDIEEGVEPKKTEILENAEEISKRIVHIIKKSDILCICSTIGGMQFSYINFFYVIKETMEKFQNGKHKGIRWLISINDIKDIELVKIFLNEGIKIKHIYSTPFVSYVLSNSFLASTIENIDKERMITSMLTSNYPLYLEHYNAIFDEQWKTGIDAKDRIKDIEKGRYVNIKILPNSKESIKLTYELFGKVKYEVLIMLPSLNGFFRTEKSYGFKILNGLASKGIKVKVLSPLDYKNQAKVDQIISNYNHIEFRNLQFTLETVNRITIFDRAKTMILEIKDDTKDNFIDVFGLGIFIESKSTALSYAEIFDSLWKQAEMYDQLEYQKKMQKEFINIAAHELRTPIQPILGLTEIVKNEIKDNHRHKELLDIVISNAKKLKKLSDDILDVTKIESHYLQLNKETFNLNDIILDIINNYRNSLHDKIIKFEYFFSIDNVIIYADKNRISQVISSLIENSVKFISEEEEEEERIISITTEKKKSNTSDTATQEKVVVSVKDTGIGIDKELLPRLFTKFSSKSFHGTGLGLFISKNIVEAHGGKIWAENNKDGQGATFGFSLPFVR
jgi:two-component system, OmpR family, sensor histidine kinase VicK